MKKIIKIVFSLLVVLLVMGCSEKRDTGTTAAVVKDTIKYTRATGPASIDPQNAANAPSFQVTRQIFDGLVNVNRNFQIEPKLATDWKISADALTYTFNLRNDVTFHNGDKFTAHDLQYTFERAMGSPFCALVTEMIEETRVINDYTFEVFLKYPYAPMMECFGSTFLRVVNRKVVEEKGEAFSYDVTGAGTGPYQFVSWPESNQIVLKAYDKYYGGKAAIENAEILVIPDATTRALALENGEVDISFIAVNDIPQFEGSAKFAVQVPPGNVYNFVDFNNNRPPFDNKLVRQAIAYSCDKTELLIASQGSVQGGTVTALAILEGQSGFDASLVPYPKDIEKAKQLMAQAGYANGFSTTIIATDDAFRRNIATYLQSCMREIGITATIEIQQSSAQQANMRNGNYEMGCMGFTPTSVDTDFYLYGLYYTGTTYNWTGYSNSNLDNILLRARSEQDSIRRDSLYKEAGRILYEDMPDLPTYIINSVFAYDNNLNFIAPPTPIVDFYEISWK